MKVKVCKGDEYVFWKDFVLKRQPCLFPHLSDDLKLLPAVVTLDALLQHAGDEVVVIETRAGLNDTFGRGKKRNMKVREFVKHLQNSEPLVYLSTQPAARDPDGHPTLMSPPLASIPDVPKKPHISGALIPQSVNLWMGRSEDGTSSGLHHDFHDNLYILLAGAKRFRLFPPSDAKCMYVNGVIKRVHPNGRILYEGEPPANADGACPADMRAWLLKKKADEASSRGKGSTGASSSESEGQEAALEDALVAFRDGDVASDSFSDEEQSWDSASRDGLKEGSDRERVGVASSACGQCNGSTIGSHEGSAKEGDHETEPPSFSKVDLRLDADVLRRQFPDFPPLESCQEVTVKARQMLYLPAGWFHEVTSFSVDSSAHNAVNYWFHPPDNLPAPDSGRLAIEYSMRHPYTADFWPELWNDRCRRHKWGEPLWVCTRGMDRQEELRGKGIATDEGGAHREDTHSGAELTRKRRRQL